jgi:CRP-like cAMP-binding protein
MTTEPAQEQLLSVLLTAKNHLEYLTANDWSLIIDRGKRVTFPRRTTLVEQGKQAKLVYLLVKGKANIEVSKTRIAQIGPGEICGEMAFIENALASATVTADEEVEAFAIEWPALSDLFELFPHLASRFYRSIAVGLSRRLRDQIGFKRSKT